MVFERTHIIERAGKPGKPKDMLKIILFRVGGGGAGGDKAFAFSQIGLSGGLT